MYCSPAKYQTAVSTSCSARMCDSTGVLLWPCYLHSAVLINQHLAGVPACSLFATPSQFDAASTRLPAFTEGKSRDLCANEAMLLSDGLVCAACCAQLVLAAAAVCVTSGKLRRRLWLACCFLTPELRLLPPRIMSEQITATATRVRKDFGVLLRPRWPRLCIVLKPCAYLSISGLCSLGIGGTSATYQHAALTAQVP